MTLRAALGALALVAATGCASPDLRETPPTPDAPAASEPFAQALYKSGFTGEAVVSRRPGDLSSVSIGRAARDDADNPERWPWASVTKQVLAVLAMQQVEAGTLDLDAPADRYLPELASKVPSPSIRQLLQHRSGLANPDDSPPDATGFPSFYSEGPTGLDWCLADRSAPSDQWRYNNCDYIVLGAILENVTGEPIEALLEKRIAIPSGWRDTALLRAGSARDFAGRDPVYTTRIARYGTSAALIGPLADMLRFDRALMAGKLLGPEARAAMWQGDPQLGYMALGQWVFDAPLEGCDAPVRIVERRGAIGKYQVRNIILPQRDMALALATADGEFDFGEIWTGSGALHDALAALACNAIASPATPR